MSSREIAELLGARHDNVKRTIETLASKGVFKFPQSEEIPTATKPTRVYLLDKRSSLIVVAQLSPEFTARVVDRWQELEAQVTRGWAVQLPDFTNPVVAARAWADEAEQKLIAQRENKLLAAANAEMKDELEIVTVDEFRALNHAYWPRALKSRIGQVATSLARAGDIPGGGVSNFAEALDALTPT